MSEIQTQLYKAITQIDDEDAVAVLSFLNRFVIRDDIATTEDMVDIQTARREFAKGEVISLSKMATL